MIFAGWNKIQNLWFKNICPGIDRVASNLVGLWFFQEAMHAAVFRFNQTVSRWIFNRSQNDSCGCGVFRVFANDCLQIEVCQDVTVEYNGRLANEILGKLVGARSAHWLWLNSVFKFHTKIRTIAKQLFDLVGL